MNSFATLANNLLENKIAKGELHLIKEKKQPTLDGMDEDDISMEAKLFCLQHDLCMKCFKPLKDKMNGDGFCDRKTTKCHSFRLKSTRKKFRQI